MSKLTKKISGSKFLLTVTLSGGKIILMKTEYSLDELAAAVCAWCDEHGVRPANGQAADAVTERTIRYYRTLGLLDAPGGGRERGFGEKHRLQLLAIRLYQAQGLPLRKIRDQLYGLAEADLRELVEPAGQPRLPVLPPPVESLAGPESWSVAPLGRDLVVVARRGRPLPPVLLSALRSAVDAYFTQTNQSN
jgi:DNA-binding transcriptional MerR regulator